MWSFKNKSPEVQVERVKKQLRSFIPGQFHVLYDPAFPGSYEIFKWFQVVFEIKAGDDLSKRKEVHNLFEKILPHLAEIELVRESDLVSLRARRHFPDAQTYNPDWPFMFIEAGWAGCGVEIMKKNQNFGSWPEACLEYVNWFDPKDPFNKRRQVPRK